MTISEKVAYIQGLFDGMGLDKSESGEAKVLSEMLDVLKEVADQLETVDSTLDEFGEEIDAISDDLADVEAQAGEDVCAVLLELVQGEGGVLPMDRDFVRALAGLCEQRDWLLLVDEVQTGIGRTGTLFAFQQYGIRPDAVSFAKGIAGGLPMGGFLVNEKCRPVLGPGSHASTFGGNPVCSAAALAVLDILDEAALNRVREKGIYLREHIEAMGKQCLGATRGLGLMIGVEVRPGWSSRELAARLAGHGLLVLTAGPALRLLPPLTITKGEMDQGLAILDRGLE